MDDSLAIRIAALFAILVASAIGVATPALVHRATTGRWPLPWGIGSASHVHAPNDDDTSVVVGDAEARPMDTAKPTYGIAASQAPLHDRREAPLLAMMHQQAEGYTEDDPDFPGATPIPFQPNYMHIVKLMSALGCGTIVATGMCHIAPDAQTQLSQVWEGDYPYPFAIATAVIVVMYVFEHELTVMLTTRAAKHTARHRNRQASAGTSDDERVIRASIVTHVLEIGVAVHSVIIGFAMGMLTQAHPARNLAIALVFHQFSEGCAIGAAVLESQLRLRHTLLLWAIFSFTTPCGVALGIAVEQAQQNSSETPWRVTLTQGVLDSVAFGILMYMALVDMMPGLFRVSSIGATPTTTPATEDEGNDLAATDGPPPPLWYRAMLYACLATGACGMCVIAVWA